MKMRTEYQEQRLDEVMRYFARDFQCQPGEVIRNVEFWVDPARNSVVFKLYVQEREENPK